ncbi:YdhR family protein [Alteraurantiacibacter aquimixticola]|uniref:Monooxygenase n=1 Tax=Alteraurantiacibacter aquimixticola TaxID=2489173 RepID=A0A4T3EYJ7_9SPHN|nr:YdhR family protein [Alteraurantiacibacter aquimixticola]TIX49738.1 hypothetical protein E5222_13065 [Alteraurantiacibacter aquimixticola]
MKYKLPAPVPREDMAEAFALAEEQFASLPGLVRKYFCYDEGAHCGHSVYLFTDQASAEAFFGPRFVLSMQEKFSTTPEVFGVDTVLVVDGPEA